MTHNIIQFRSKEKNNKQTVDTFAESLLDEVAGLDDFLDSLDEYKGHVQERFIESKYCRVFYSGMTRISIETFDNVKGIQQRKKTGIIRA